MTLVWVRNPVTGSFRASIFERDFIIEPAAHGIEGWEVWYGRQGRRLRVGLVDTLSAAKALAEDVLTGILRHNKIVGE